MKNFTFKMLSFLFLGFLGFTSNAQEWNFSSPTLSVLGSTTATKTVEGLTIYAAAAATVDVDANAKTLEGMTFTNRLKLGGSGTFDATTGVPVSRVLTFPVTGNTKITIMGMSSSSSADRQLVVAAGNKDTELGRFAALGASISKGEFTYTGGPTTIYLFSPSSGVNIYYIKAALITSAKINKVSEFTIFPNPATGKVFINLDKPAEIGIFNISGQLVRQQLIASSKSYINVSDLHSGIYFVKMMNGSDNTQKLIIR